MIDRRVVSGPAECRPSKIVLVEMMAAAVAIAVYEIWIGLFEIGWGYNMSAEQGRADVRRVVGKHVDDAFGNGVAHAVPVAAVDGGAGVPPNFDRERAGMDTNDMSPRRRPGRIDGGRLTDDQHRSRWK